MEHFNEDAVYVNTIKPLVDELHARMQQANIPFFMVACTGHDGVRTEVRGSCLLLGPERTPHEFAVGWEFGARGMQAGMACIQSLVHQAITKGTMEIVTMTEDAEPAVDGAEPEAGADDPTVH